ncbi:MAG TPA: sigma-70 family RNA polymerase sigma factor [Gemmataceae bacterium]|nr:sigma-70 family RNA polymerase sigma factor [Gemmataceae bacterium]
MNTEESKSAIYLQNASLMETKEAVADVKLADPAMLVTPLASKSGDGNSEATPSPRCDRQPPQEWVESVMAVVRHVCQSKFLQDADTQDVGAEVCKALWMRLQNKRLRSIENFGGYARRCTLREIVKLGQRRAKVRVAKESGQIIVHGPDREQEGPVADDQELNLTRVYLAAASLPRKQKEVFLLNCELQNLRVVAEQLHMRHAAARKNHSRALASLKDMLN